VIIHQNFEQRSPRGRAVDFDSADLSTGDVDDVQVYVISTPGEDGIEILLSFKIKSFRRHWRREWRQI
jgi:hypothetical protein